MPLVNMLHSIEETRYFIAHETCVVHQKVSNIGNGHEDLVVFVQWLLPLLTHVRGLSSI